MIIYRLAQTEPIEYMLEDGMLYDSEAEDVFSIRELGQYKVPLFKSPRNANIFLENLETATGKTFGRVPEEDLLHSIRYKDTKKERQDANMQNMEERNKRWEKGQF